MNRDYLLIPEWEHLNESTALADTFHAAFEYNDFARPTVYENPDEVRKRIEKYCSLERDRSKDTMHGAFLDVVWSSQDSVIRERGCQLVKMSLETALKLGVRGVVFHTGLIERLEIESYLNDWLDQSDSFWHRMMEQYPGVKIYMENTFERTPAMLIALKKRMADMVDFELCLDYGHAILSGTPIDTWVHNISPYVGHIHLNDNDTINDLHMVPGDGKIDFQHCKENLEQYLKNIPTLLELNGLDNQRRALIYMNQL